MDDTRIIAAYVIIDDVLRHHEHRSHSLAQVSDVEVLTVAVVSAMYFQNHHERTLCIMRQLGYIPARLSTSRFSRRLHARTNPGFEIKVVASLIALVCINSF